LAFVFSKQFYFLAKTLAFELFEIKMIVCYKKKVGKYVFRKTILGNVFFLLEVNDYQASLHVFF
jgi:hypothetical protein